MPRSVSMLAALAALAFHVPDAQAGNGGSASVRVSARVLGVARVRVQGADSFTLPQALPAMTAVETGDVRLEVFCNQRSLSLRFDIAEARVADVRVSGFGAPLALGGSGAAVRIPMGPSRRASFLLRYEVRYRTGLAAGRWPVPVRVSVGEE